MDFIFSGYTYVAELTTIEDCSNVKQKRSI